MNYVQVNPNISYASIASGKFKTIYLSLLPPKPYQQRFPLPYDVMKYILQNPKSPDQLLKLYQTCKYFYFKNQVLIISGDLTFNGLQPKLTFRNNFNCFKNTKSLRIWFDGDLFVRTKYCLNFSKIYRSTLKSLAINKSITLKEFELLVAENTVKNFHFYSKGCIKNSVTDEDVPVDAILQLLPNVTKFWYFNKNEIYSKKVLEKMNALKKENKFEQYFIYLKDVPDDFDAALLFEFVLKNVGKFGEIILKPRGENKHAILLELIGAEERFKALKEWNHKKFVLRFALLE